MAAMKLVLGSILAVLVVSVRHEEQGDLLDIGNPASPAALMEEGERKQQKLGPFELKENEYVLNFFTRGYYKAEWVVPLLCAKTGYWLKVNDMLSSTEEASTEHCVKVTCAKEGAVGGTKLKHCPKKSDISRYFLSGDPFRLLHGKYLQAMSGTFYEDTKSGVDRIFVVGAQSRNAIPVSKDRELQQDGASGLKVPDVTNIRFRFTTNDILSNGASTTRWRSEFANCDEVMRKGKSLEVTMPINSGTTGTCQQEFRALATECTTLADGLKGMTAWQYLDKFTADKKRVTWPNACGTWQREHWSGGARPATDPPERETYAGSWRFGEYAARYNCEQELDPAAAALKESCPTRYSEAWCTDAAVDKCLSEAALPKFPEPKKH
mmetsp:Transcript_33024/g.94678  ORF Transcript_33024/g.94678 Transcript_33024/m.94678 type:complete len:380 (+) Transcript_33024:93-1232(+)